MEFLTHSCSFTPKWWHNNGKLNTDVIFSLFIYLLILAQFVSGNHEYFHEPISKATLSTEYIDSSGRRQTHDYQGSGHYGTMSEVNSQPIKGQLVLVKTLYNKSDLGCGPLDPSIVPSTGPWVALVKRGSCEFNHKIYYAAKNASASAVIVYNSKVTETFENVTMKTEGDDFDVHDVVAILIHYNTGTQLVELLQAYEKVNITITHVPEDKKPNANPDQLNNMSVMFVSISFIVLVTFNLSLNFL